MSADQRRALRRERLRRTPQPAAEKAAGQRPNPEGPTTGQWLRQALHRVSDGSFQLALHGTARGIVRLRDRGKRVTAWVGEAEGFDKLIRLGLLLALGFVVRKVATAIALWAYHRIESRAWGWPAFITAGVWIVCAYRAGRPGWKPKPPKQKPAPAAEAVKPSEKQPEPAEQPAPVSLQKPQLPTRDELAVALHAIGRPHVHTSALAEHLGVTKERAREALDAAHIPREGGVRMKGRLVAVSPGVKDENFPPLPSPPSERGPEGPLNSNNNDNNAFTTVPDDHNPVRTHVVWNTPEATE